MLKQLHKKTLIESYEGGKYNIYEINDEGISHFVVKDTDKIDKHDGEVPFVSLEECRNYLKSRKKVIISSAKKLNVIAPDLIENVKKPNKKADLKTIEGVLEDMEDSLNNFKEGHIITSDMETRLNVYQQATTIHALKFAKEKFEYVQNNKMSEESINRLKLITGGNGHK